MIKHFGAWYLGKNNVTFEFPNSFDRKVTHDSRI